jgi:hypothetical protein
MKCYMMSYMGERQPILDAIEKVPEIVNWQAGGGAIFMVSEKNTEWLTEVIHEKLPDLTFVICPTNIGQMQGYLPKVVWEFIQRPRKVGE